MVYASHATQEVYTEWYMPPYHTRVYIPRCIPPYYASLGTPSYVHYWAGYTADNGPCAVREPWAQYGRKPWV